MIRSLYFPCRRLRVADYANQRAVRGRPLREPGAADDAAGAAGTLAAGEAGHRPQLLHGL